MTQPLETETQEESQPSIDLTSTGERTKWWAPLLVAILITLVALLLRTWQLDSAPPGWRDDELINSLVISQKVLDGDWSVYYADASGHEALYHVLNAGMLALFGPSVAGIRLLSVALGTLTILLTYLVANRLYGSKVALLATAGLALSFWSLMYSRIGIRHISMPLFMLATFYFFWRGLAGKQNGSAGESESEGQQYSDQRSAANGPNPLINFALAGLFMGLGFYTYFASRIVPVMLLIYCLYLLLVSRTLLRKYWRFLLLMFILAAVIALPLVITLFQQPESEARVEELAVPLVEAQSGNLQPLGEHIVRTLSMFHSDGDDEWLYNIPYRPIFGPVGAVFFWTGVLLASWYGLKPLVRLVRKTGRSSGQSPTAQIELASAFTLIWWLVGIAPAFISVPAASMGHTIAAQPAVYILAALPILPISNFLRRRLPKRQHMAELLTVGLGLLLLVSIAIRDLPDYYQTWPNRGLTRFLYRADIKNVADYLHDNRDLTDFGITGLMAGPWDRIALEIDVDDLESVKPRWYNPERAVLLQSSGVPATNFSGFPLVPTLNEHLYEPVPGETAGGYTLATVSLDLVPSAEPVCFENGLCLLTAEYDSEEQTLDLIWEVSERLVLPPIPLISNPPPPGVYDGPRLLVFAQLLDGDGVFLVGEDGFWVDPSSLLPGDRFLQQHRLGFTGNSLPASAAIGLYDPLTGVRILTVDGLDHVIIDIAE